MPRDDRTPQTPRTLRSPALRWAVPAGAVAVLAAGVAFTSANADAAAQLPPRTAAQLLADLAKAPRQPLSGTVVETAKLGLPELPTTGGSTSLQSLVTGSHTARVWYGAGDKARFSLVGDLAQTDVVRNGDDVWTWSSTTREAKHYTLKERDGATNPSPAPGVATDPATAAKQALAAVDPTTKVSVDGTGYVADRPVYELLLEPRDARSLVGSVRLAVDSATSVPLRVQVFARGAQEPAFETGFTDVQFEQPAASIFTFTPPPGAKVTEGNAPTRDKADRTKAPEGDRPTVVGSGWTSVAVLKGVDLGSLGQDATANALLRGTSTVTGPYGTGRLLRTALVSVLVVGDTAYVGAVEPSVLEQAAAKSTTR